MYKTMVLVRRKAGVARADLFQVWEHEHAANVVKAFDPVRYALTFFDPTPDGADPPFDGMVELTYRDQAHLDRVGVLREDFQAVDDFRERMLDWTSVQAARTTSHVIVAGPAADAAVKRVVIVRRRADDLSAADYRRHLLEVHAPNVAAAIGRTPSCVRYVIDTVEPNGPTPFDGIAHYYWRSSDGMRDGLAGLEDDGTGRVSAPDGITVLAGREVLIVT